MSGNIFSESVIRSAMRSRVLDWAWLEVLPIASAIVIIVLGFVIAIKSLISGGILVVNL